MQTSKQKENLDCTNITTTHTKDRIKCTEFIILDDSLSETLNPSPQSKIARGEMRKKKLENER